MPKSTKKPAKTAKARFSEERLRELVEEATVDAYDECEQVTGLYTVIADELEMPFETDVLGVKVTVESVELTDRDEIVAICRNGLRCQRIGILELNLPSPPLQGSQWIEAYRWWAGHWR